MKMAINRLEYQEAHRAVRALIEVVDQDRKYLVQAVLNNGEDQVVLRLPVHRKDIEALRSAVHGFLLETGVVEQMRSMLHEHAG